MAIIREITDIVERFAGTEVFFEGDNIGLLLGNPLGETDSVLCCLDVTDCVINQAIELKARLIVSHHPLIFSPIKSITADNPLGKMLIRLIKNDISVYSAHTNLDFCAFGINDYAANLAGISQISSMSDNFGRIGAITPAKLSDYARNLQKIFECNAFVSGEDKLISRVAIINGAGGGSEHYIDLAANLGADCLITSEIKHHIALYAQNKDVALIEIPHFSAEHCYISKLKELIEQGAKSIRVYVADEDNPLRPI